MNPGYLFFNPLDMPAGQVVILAEMFARMRRLKAGSFQGILYCPPQISSDCGFIMCLTGLLVYPPAIFSKSLSALRNKLKWSTWSGTE